MQFLLKFLFNNINNLTIIALRSFLLLVQKKRTKEKDTFSKVFLSLRRQNRMDFPKFSPRLQKFFTENPSYTTEKGRHRNSFRSFFIN